MYPNTDSAYIQLANSTSASELTAGFTFAAVTIINTPSVATAQIDRILNTMLYESKAVYIGIAPSVAGVVISVAPGGTGGSAASTGYSVGAGQINAASAGEFLCCVNSTREELTLIATAIAMAFIR